jgi:hypothetical protein
MRILINDKPVSELAPKVEKSLMLAKVQPEVKARVLTPDEATRAFFAMTKRWFAILGGGGVVFMLVIAIAGIVGDPMDGALVAVGAVVAGTALFLFLWWLLGHRMRSWNRKLQHRSDGLPPAGTSILLDDKALSVGSDVLPWRSLAIDQIELTGGSVPSGDTSTLVHLIERLSLASGGRTFVLDRAMMENGTLMVDNTWRKLSAPIP